MRMQCARSYQSAPANVVANVVEFGFDLSMEANCLSHRYSRKAMLKPVRLAGHALLLALLVSAAPLSAKRAPDPSFKTLNGQTRKLSALRGQIVVVNFWATWCGPCQEELPRLSQIAANYAGKPVQFVLVSIDKPKDRGRIPEKLANLHVTVESWVNADTDTLGRFGLGDIVPGTVILDEKGEIAARIMGEATEVDVRGAVDWLLAGKTGPPPPALTKRY